MGEKIYKSMAITGAGNVVIGIIIMATGVACGIISIVSGARLLKNKSDIMF